jgi:hypothetical protein
MGACAEDRRHPAQGFPVEVNFTFVIAAGLRDNNTTKAQFIPIA